MNGFSARSELTRIHRSLVPSSKIYAARNKYEEAATAAATMSAATAAMAATAPVKTAAATPDVDAQFPHAKKTYSYARHVSNA